jgi:hypothetical protein
MLGRLRTTRDPFWDDGVGARSARTRHRIVSSIAFALAIAACGLTSAAWLRTVGPALEQLVR